MISNYSLSRKHDARRFSSFLGSGYRRGKNNLKLNAHFRLSPYPSSNEMERSIRPDNSTNRICRICKYIKRERKDCNVFKHNLHCIFNLSVSAT